MVLPLALLKTSQRHPIMVELKNGETYSGILALCDNFMNLQMRDAICTSRDGERFWKVAEISLRGNQIKSTRLPEDALDLVKEETARRESGRGAPGRGRGRGRGIRGGRGGPPNRG
eukprot:TRINITY_DN5303_c1_g1_i3.p1 TRINITY_DN5303_c1_g1~~TRINITY_DN5303_c1_g1_i3.p1  ORF type:complete len:116 (-),score=10.90 TRINITY_DN5303_c1_g1_i3:107-454(-)